MAPTDERFDVPLYSVTEAAHHIDVPVSAFRTWTHGYERRSVDRRPVTGEAIVTTLPRDAGVSVPFIGLAEAHTLAAIRRSGVPLQRIRPALQRLQDELGIEHVLASRSLYTDGAEVFYDFAESQGDTPEACSARRLGAAHPPAQVRHRGRRGRPEALVRPAHLRQGSGAPRDRHRGVQGRHRHRRSHRRVRCPSRRPLERAACPHRSRLTASSYRPSSSIGTSAASRSRPACGQPGSAL